MESKKLLLIEDDVFVRDLYRRELQKAGFIVEIGQDGQEGIDRAKSELFDFVLLDIMMPKKTGIDVLKELKADPKTRHYPIYLLTNLGQESIIREAIELGAVGYLLKAQLLPREVVEAVRKYFEEGPMKIDLSQLE
ncbi:MAG: hypothetical protein A2Y57_04825 [Candidatus Woykebacteria bacterium RBG_13_40_7b]|uniref:Response regulatory domain-containing protein n=1 Tax=Candidatus Woykebacteria bacterium RBG_13_40_7b TaxID=1802594 RepID=A0A1G1WBU2_9BACT|nr:MAG: hypothetical protein A2Y57_04825 [Candidatus Woykebacteria bacterium RBG_13_40_7b]